ncbi:MAG: hypothetical protein AAFR96_00460 [Planctomycetota bacterium]
MSAKWRRVQAWDKQNLVGPLVPVRWVLHALSSIALAVVVLTAVSVYSVLASVPIGLLALGVTWAVYGLTLLVAAGVPAVGLALIARRVVTQPAAKFVVAFAGVLGGAIAGTAIWSIYAWPALHFDPVTGAGLRLFPAFVETYQNTTLRRLPMFEMTELEFYSWWPMRLLLAIFVINMVVATIRRIEFKFVNIGVLTVHTGIVLIAVGSIYYQAFKREGDTILLASDASAGTVVGPAQQIYYDREDPALLIFDGRGWKQIPVTGDLPRYNDYALDAGVEDSAKGTLGFGEPIDTSSDDSRTLDIDLTATARSMGAIPDDTSLRITGYATYADPVRDWVPDGLASNPLRMMYLVDKQAQATQGGTGRLVGFAMLPNDPEFAAVEYAGVVGVDYAVDMPNSRWRALTTPAFDAAHLVVAEVQTDAGPETLVIPADRPGRAFEVAGWSLVVEELMPEPPFAIITDGYEDATSAIAVVRITSPEGKVVRRWVYHRFPELNQDLADATTPEGRPERSDPDQRLSLHYIDQSKLQIYVNERSETGLIDIAFRFAGGFDLVEGHDPSERYQTPVDRIAFDFGARWDNARELDRPSSVPVLDREGDFIGTHDRAMIAVEVSTNEGFSQTVWLPYARYAHDAGTRGGSQRTITLPDGRPVSVMFGRQWFSLPGFQLRLIDFEMIAYDHRGAPRDYQSLVRVEPSIERASLAEPYDHVTKLNAPLKAPFLWNDSRNIAANVAGELVSHLSPYQFKFSQAGWDRQGWEETQAQVDAGLAQAPTVRFTILGVGNNPGIHVIALGGVLMGVGIPWAFYIKPWLVKRKKKQIQAQLARDAASRAAESKPHPQPVGAAT